MSEFTVKSGIDVWTWSTRPTANYNGGKQLAVSTTRHSFIWLRVPAVQSDMVQVSRLRLKVTADFPGSANLTVRRVYQSWKARDVTWGDRPSTVTTTGYDEPVSALVVGDVIEIDITPMIANAAGGAAYYGVRVESDSATTLYLASFESGDGSELYVQTGAAPGQPTNLTPADGVIGKSKWICGTDFIDHIGDTDLAYMQVQVDPAADTLTPDFDSGAYPVEAPLLDLAATDMPGGLFTALASGATTQWRTRLQDGAGLWSPWSDWVTVTYRPKRTVTITNPTGGIVGTPTPTISATLSAGTAEVWRVMVRDSADLSLIRYDTFRKHVGVGGMSLEVPEKWDGQRVMKDDRTYQARVRVWDEYDRVASTDDPTYSEATVTFAMDDDAGVTAPDSLIAVTPVNKKPATRLTWHRAVQPDQFLIMRDGVVVRLVEASDLVRIDGVTYDWTDVGITGYREHTWKVRAITAGVRSNAATVVFTPTPEGVWLMTEDDGWPVQLFEVDAINSLTNTDQSGTYDVLGRRFSTRVVTALSGRRATGLEFVIMDDPEGYKTWEQYEANMLAIKANPLTDYRYYAGADNLLVRISNVTVTERSDSLPGQTRRLVRFDLEQVGDFEYDGRV